MESTTSYGSLWVGVVDIQGIGEQTRRDASPFSQVLLCLHHPQHPSDSSSLLKSNVELPVTWYPPPTFDVCENHVASFA